MGAEEGGREDTWGQVLVCSMAFFSSFFPRKQQKVTVNSRTPAFQELSLREGLSAISEGARGREGGDGNQASAGTTDASTSRASYL